MNRVDSRAATSALAPFGSPGRAARLPGILAPVAATPGSSLVARAKWALYSNFEAALVLLLVASLLFIQSFVVHKFAFLLFYFIPVLLAGFYLSARHAVFTAVLAAGLVTYVTLLDPFGSQAASGTAGANPGFWPLLTWASFLVIAGALVGRLQEKNQAQVAQLREAYVGIIQILTKYLEAADIHTKSHSERVATLAGVLADRMELAPHEVQNVWTAALLHDIGKAEVVQLIRKAASLEPHEKVKVDAHVELGAQLLLTTGSVLRDAVPLVLEHHRPYQDGADGIPIGARIIAVADAYDAIVSDRPYRQGRSHWEAVQILEDAAGRQFDPAVVRALKESEPLVLAQYR
jgi:putative nucleotidyltransferase with HDIG domain